jgi:2-keto-4-pentenoate hydratase/2-oxohepta-3-ene-1,7-dioic acid hydratase in catechol pathway
MNVVLGDTSEFCMPVVVYETRDATPQVGIRRGTEIVAVESLDSGEGLKRVSDCIPLIRTLESEAEAAIAEAGSSVDPHDLSAVTLHSPVDPSKIVRIEGSYEHDLTDEEYNPFINTESLHERDWPRLWVAPMSAMAKASDPLVVPTFANEVKPSVELAVVVGSAGKNWSYEEATEAIAGCLVLADIGIYDSLPGQWGYKFFDSAMRFGTDLVSARELDLSSLELSLELNGEVVDTKSTDGWRFTPGEMVSTVSEIMSLQPGDIITTGNPMRVDGTIDAGDELRATVEDVDTVVSSIRREETDSEVLI